MKFGVVVFPGSNCEQDCLYVLRDVLEQETVSLWHEDTSTRRVDCIVLPGGFSYGDYLRTGAIARFSPIMKSVVVHAKRGGLVLGICNGFQILLEAELLPGAMLRNVGLRFICKAVTMRVERTDTPFTNRYESGQIIQMPIAHNEGNYTVDPKTLTQMQQNRQILLRYADAVGQVGPEANPNGSVDNIAGICNAKGNVMGLMPHPERCAEPELGGADGRLLFESILNAEVLR